MNALEMIAAIYTEKPELKRGRGRPVKGGTYYSRNKNRIAEKNKPDIIGEYELKDEKVIKVLNYAVKTCLIKTKKSETKFALGKKQYAFVEYFDKILQPAFKILFKNKDIKNIPSYESCRLWLGRQKILRKESKRIAYNERHAHFNRFKETLSFNFQIPSNKKDDQKREKLLHTMLVFIDNLEDTEMKKYYTNKFITPFANNIDKSKFFMMWVNNMNRYKSPFTHGWTTPITSTGKPIPVVAI